MGVRKLRCLGRARERRLTPRSSGAPTAGSTILQSRTLAFADFHMPVQMHRYAILKHRSTPQNIDSSALVAFQLRSHRGALRTAVSTQRRGLLNVSSCTHRRTSSVLLPHLGQRRWEMANYRRAPTFFLSLGSKHGIDAASHLSRAFSVQPVLPNPSLNRTRYGRPVSSNVRQFDISITLDTVIFALRICVHLFASVRASHLG